MTHQEDTKNKLIKRYQELGEVVDRGLSLQSAQDAWNALATRLGMQDRMVDFDWLVWGLFFRDIAPGDLVNVIVREINPDAAKAKEMALAILGELMMPFAAYYEGVAEAFTALGGDPDEALLDNPIYDELIDTVLKEIETNAAKAAETFDYEGERKAIIDIFEQHFVSVLTMGNDVRSDYNDLVFHFLRHEQGYNNLLSEALLQNRETIGHYLLTVDGKQTEPTVSAWLRDFIATVGVSGMTNVAIARYMGTNPAVMKLQDFEKKSLRSLINAFVTLKNFPDSLANVPMAEWMVIPYERVSADIVGERVARSAVTATAAMNVVVAPTITGVSAPVVNPVVTPVTSPALTSTPTAPSVQAPAPLAPPPPVSTPAPAPSGPQLSRVSPHITNMVESIVRTSGLVLTDEQISKRVRQALVSRVKDIRDRYELKAHLVQAGDMGGVGLSEAEADILVQAAERVMNPESVQAAPASKPAQEAFKEDIRPIVKMPQTLSNLPHVAEPVEITPAMAAELVYTGSPVALGLASSVTSTVGAKISTKAPANTGPSRLAIQEIDGVPMLMERESKKPAPMRQPVKPVPPPPPVAPIVAEVPIPVVATPASSPVMPTAHTPSADGLTIPLSVLEAVGGAATSTTPKAEPSRLDPSVMTIPVTMHVDTAPSPHTMNLMDGAHTTPGANAAKLIDPIEELRTTTLVDFRRLNPDPYAAVKRLYQKIQLMEKQSFAERQKGIQAWHESEVGKVYAETGVEVFGRGVPMDQVIADRQAKGLPYLTAPEMDALMELNEMIRI